MLTNETISKLQEMRLGVIYNFRIPDQKVFSGFKEIPALWPEAYSVK